MTTTLHQFRTALSLDSAAWLTCLFFDTLHIMWSFYIQVAWAETFRATKSHRFRTAPPLDSAAWPHCLLLKLLSRFVFCFVLHAYVKSRDLSDNQITSISNGAFTDLGRLITLFVARTRCTLYLNINYESWTGTWLTTGLHWFQKVPSLDWIAWLHCLGLLLM